MLCEEEKKGRKGRTELPCITLSSIRGNHSIEIIVVVKRGRGKSRSAFLGMFQSIVAETHIIWTKGHGEETMGQRGGRPACCLHQLAGGVSRSPIPRSLGISRAEAGGVKNV